MAAGHRGKKSKSRARARRRGEKLRKVWSYGCKTGKQCFDSRSVAEAQVRKINAKGAAAGTLTKTLKRAYQCERCGRWHTTSRE